MLHIHTQTHTHNERIKNAYNLSASIASDGSRRGPLWAALLKSQYFGICCRQYVAFHGVWMKQMEGLFRVTYTLAMLVNLPDRHKVSEHVVTTTKSFMLTMS